MRTCRTRFKSDHHVDDLYMRRKLVFKAQSPQGMQQVVLVKKVQESLDHVLIKALIWGLYLPIYPDLRIEVPIGDRYKPDVITLNPGGEPIFWGESGHVGKKKIISICKRFPETHFVFAKWRGQLPALKKVFAVYLKGIRRRAPVDLVCFPADSATRFVTAQGEIQIDRNVLDTHRFEGDGPCLPGP